MDLNPRARCWIATVPWLDADIPRPDIIPDVGQVKAHAKLSRVNDSVSIWFTFVNQVRASTISNAFTTDVIVKAVRVSDTLEKFEALPFDWQCRFIRDNDTSTNTDSVPSQHDETTIPIRDSQGESDDEIIREMRQVTKLRKRIRQLDDELNHTLLSVKRRFTSFIDS